MGVKITGLNKLKKLQKGLNELSNTDSIPMTELLNDNFLVKHSDFKGFSDFESREIFTKYQSIEDIPDSEMDEFIKEHSNFDSWEEFLGTATKEYIAKTLGF